MSNRRFLFSGSGNGERLNFYPNMKAIIAEKPSVGMDIARVVGATEKKDGYCIGNGYMVTWALGHLVSLAMPGTYGYTKTAADDLPMIPEPFRLVARQIKTAKGMVTDITANKQLKTIDEVFSKCDSIIVATDAGREGELIFRWIYDYLGYTKPFQRLWISSLTDEAIREGMENLRDGSDYDSLYAAADGRAKADWLVGMNASRALAIASGSANNSIGRVQTPTLAMICARFKENRNFVSTPILAVAYHVEAGRCAPPVYPPGRVQGQGNGRDSISENHFRFRRHDKQSGTQENIPAGSAPLRPDSLAKRLQYPLRPDGGQDPFHRPDIVREEVDIVSENGKPVYTGRCHGAYPRLIGENSGHA